MTAAPPVRTAGSPADALPPGPGPMHWLAAAAARAGIPGADTMALPRGVTVANAWDVTARALGIAVRDLTERVAPKLGMNAADFETADHRSRRLVPERLARRHAVFPLADDDHSVTVATANPTDLDAEHEIAFASGRRVVFRLAAPLSIGEAIDASYSPDRAVAHLLSSVGDEFDAVVRVVENLEPARVDEQETEAAPVVKLTNLILRDAVLGGASDVHIEPGAKGGGVRFRIDGVMRTQMQLPNSAISRVVSRIKVLSKLDIADRMRPQDGRARIEVEAKAYDLRVSTVPTREAEKAVIRVLRPDSTRGLAECGIAPRELTRLKQLLGYREGMVIVTGPTGSGKTTTLYSAIREIATGDTNIMTVEDPIEYELSGITQIQVETKRDVTFASALRAILRQDPDVIFVGEIRDGETAQIAAQAALTGHLVLATLHTNDAMGAVARLADLGLDRPTIAACLRGAIAQRLLRRVCADCSRPVSIADRTDDEDRLSGAFRKPATIRAMGCKACGSTGYRGRLPVNEVAIITPAIAEMIGNGAPTLALRHAATLAGMRPLLDVALEFAAAGSTTLKEVERVLGEAPDGADTSAVAEPELTKPTLRASITGGAATRPGLARVLVVDDDEMVRLLATTALSAGGFCAESVDDGAVALERIEAGECWDLVMTDLHMQRVNGVELLTRLRAAPSTAHLPVIVLTGSSEQDTEVAMMDAGADDYLRKPIDPPRLVARVKAALRRNTL